MSSSIEQFFNEVQAVATVLSEWVNEHDSDDIGDRYDGGVETDEERFTALWQAVELLSRGATYIMAQMQAESAKAALFLPEPVEQQGPSLWTPPDDNPVVRKRR